MSNGAEATRQLQKPIRKVELPLPTVDKKVKVTPGTVHLAEPDRAKTIQWTNNTGKPAQIWLVTVRDVLIPLHGEDLSQPQDIDAGHSFAVGVVDNLPQDLVLKDYHVHCHAIGGFGDGDSSPHIGL